MASSGSTSSAPRPHAPAVHSAPAAGRLHRIHHSVYSLVPRELLKREGLYMAAVLACGPGAVLSHRSAAALHGLRDCGPRKIEVTVPRRSGRRHAASRSIAPRPSPAQDVTVVNNIPCTTVARTLFDLAEVVDAPPARARLRPGRDRRGVRPQGDRGPARPQPHPPRRQPSARPRRATTSADADRERDRGATLALMPRIRPARAGGQCSSSTPATAARDPGRLRLARAARRRRDRRPQYHGTPPAFEADRRRDQRLTPRAGESSAPPGARSTPAARAAAGCSAS